jgi:organic hydroperoxide reductase OsmC/OhrA
MTPLPHHYEVRLEGGPSGHAVLSSPGIPDLPAAPPRDFDGPGDAWSPEHLLLAAVGTCFAFTLRSVAQASKFEFVRLAVAATGTVDRQDGVTRFTAIVLHARLVVLPGGDPARALRLLEKSEKYCLVSASLSTLVRLESEIVAEG